jgi:Fe-S oxidoreductase
VENGQTVPALDGLVQRLREESVMLAGPRSRRRLGARDLDVKDCTRESAQVVYHLGCRIAHDESLWRIPRATVALLKHAGVDVGVLGDSEACCGGLALELGYKADFLAQVNRCNAVLEGTGAGILVTNCAHCFQAFTVPYAKAGKQPPLRVMHVVQLLQELVDTGKLELGAVAPAKVTYHDPCHLGRLGEPCVPWSGTPTPGHRRMFDPPKEWRRGTRGVYGPPRGLLAEMPGVELVEMSRAKEYAWCCGGGGGVPESDPDFAAWTARERLAEAQATGAEAIITACPGCKRSLEDAAKETGAAIRVLDVVELLTSAG